MIKYLTTALLLGLGSTSVYAQTTLRKGTWQLSGSINYNQSHNESSGGGSGSSIDSKSFSVNPSVGYLVADNLALGVDAGLVRNRSQSTDGYAPSSSLRTSNQYFVGIFADYYKLFNQYFGLKGRLGTSYSHSSDDYQYYNQNSSDRYQGTGNSVGVNLIPSLLFFPLSKLSLGASFGGLYYSVGKSTQSPNIINNESQGQSFGTYFGLNQLSLSGTFYPGRK